MKSLTSFRAQSPPLKRVSKIQKFKTEVLELYRDNFTVEQIQDFLLQNDVKISTRRIYQFLKQNLNNPDFFLRTPSSGAAQKSKPQQSAQPQNSKAVSAYMLKLQKIAKENQS